MRIFEAQGFEDISSAKTIVSEDWLIDCIKSKSFVTIKNEWIITNITWYERLYKLTILPAVAFENH